MTDVQGHPPGPGSRREGAPFLVESCRMLRFSLAKAGLIVVFLTSMSSCHQPTEIVLVIDTNLTTYDIDDVKISILSSQVSPIDINLTAPGAPAFPFQRSRSRFRA